MRKSGSKGSPFLEGSDYTLLDKAELILLVRLRDQQIATYEHLLRNYTSNSTAPVDTGSVPLEKVEDKELTLNKLNRANIRTIGAILSNRSRDRDRFKFKPLNR